MNGALQRGNDGLRHEREKIGTVERSAIWGNLVRFEFRPVSFARDNDFPTITRPENKPKDSKFCKIYCGL